MQEVWVPALCQEDPPEEGAATQASIHAWRIPGQRGLAGYSPQGHAELGTNEAA